MHERQSWLARHGCRPCGRDSPSPVRWVDDPDQEARETRAELAELHSRVSPRVAPASEAAGDS
eukprot:3660596-Alexandrium_andersonii.AAC.1